MSWIQHEELFLMDKISIPQKLSMVISIENEGPRTF